MKDIYWIGLIGLLILGGSVKINDLATEVVAAQKHPIVLYDACEKNRCEDKDQAPKVLKDYFRGLNHD